jgi:hypothetical protein
MEAYPNVITDIQWGHRKMTMKARLNDSNAKELMY